MLFGVGRPQLRQVGELMSGIDNDRQENWLSVMNWQEHWQRDLYGELEGELLEMDGLW